MFSNIFFLALGSWFIYKNYMKILYFINKLYTTYIDFRKEYITNYYKYISKKFIPDSNYLIYEYSINDKVYKIITTEDKLNKNPYKIENIKNKSTKINTNIQSDDKIILAELIDKNGNIINCTDDIKSISGPLGNFYEDTTNELTIKSLKLYLNMKYSNFCYDRLMIMYSDGNEENLLSLLK